MSSTAPTPAQRDSIGQYRILRTLRPGRSFLAQGQGRPVIIKLLDGECLVHGRLHPNIHDRLARVRELAHIGVANLHGVERDGELAFAVWEYVPGETLDRHAAQLDSPATLARLVRELILALQALHALGIVHGKIHGGNVIVDPLGAIHLTHVSPLLYDDPMVDARDLCSMLADITTQRGWADSSLARVAGQGLSLWQLRDRLALSANGAAPGAVAEPLASRAPRRLSLAAAAVVTVLAAALALAMVRLSHSVSGRKPLPPQAPPQAFDSP
jgi:hypothetical protein